MTKGQAEKRVEARDMANLTGRDVWLYSNGDMAARGSDRAKANRDAGLTVTYIASAPYEIYPDGNIPE